MHRPVFTNWSPSDAFSWGLAPQRLAHSWHESALFAPEALAELIERYPLEHYSLVHTSQQGEDKKTWREGEVGELSGKEVLAAIERGGLWLNLRNVHLVDLRYGALQDQAYAELRQRVPGFEPSALHMGILISSPNAKVHYHCDLPGQALWQIRGRKRVYVYPPQAPFLPPEALEQIALSGVEVNLPYEPGFDERALVMELEPGHMLHWPLNSPHRVDNHDCLNVSVTTEHWTPSIRRSQMVTMANGVLRQHLGWRPSRDLQGPAFWAKAALQAAWRRSPWARQRQRLARPIDFRLTKDLGQVDIPAYHR